MSIVNHNTGAIFLCKGNNLGKVCNISLHAEYTIYNDQLILRFMFPEYPFKIIHVIVPELLNLAEGKSASVDNACMIHLIDDYDIIFSHKCGNNTQVDLKAGREYKSSLFPREPR